MREIPFSEEMHQKTTAPNKSNEFESSKETKSVRHQSPGSSIARRWQSKIIATTLL